MDKLIDRIRKKYFYYALIGSVLLVFFGAKTLLQYYKSKIIEQPEVWLALVSFLIGILFWLYVTYVLIRQKIRKRNGSSNSPK